MRYYTFSIFHVLIIACLGFTFLGCGYKGPPVYKDKETQTQTATKTY